jgi:periplasmic copper chaperone A
MISNVFRGALRAAALALFLFGLSARSGSTAAQGAPAPAIYRIGTITVEQPWSRATPGGAKVAAGYMRITNTGAEPDRLVGGTFAAARRFELHEMSVGTDNVMRMRPLESGLAIEPGATVDLKPGGFHAMFLDLDRALKEGESLAGTLRFEKAGTVAVTYAVGGLGAQGPSAGHHGHH